MLKFPITLAIILLPMVALAQSPPPKVGNKPLTRVRTSALGGCKLVGDWAGIGERELFKRTHAHSNHQ